MAWVQELNITCDVPGCKSFCKLIHKDEILNSSKVLKSRKWKVLKEHTPTSSGKHLCPAHTAKNFVEGVENQPELF